MSEPTLQDCINYMRSQIKQMEKHPRSYEFNLPYYRKTVELLERRKTNDETFEWCHDCKEYDQKNHCCHSDHLLVSGNILLAWSDGEDRLESLEIHLCGELLSERHIS